MSGFFEELQRRKVYRVAVAYVIAAGGIIQLASAVFPAWEMPSWALRLVIVLLLLGFPIALIFAWAFDVTPSGIQRTDDAVAPASGSRPLSRRRRNVVLLAVVGAVVSLAAGFFLLPRASARRIDKSIAVLPFENFSDDKENAFFADGIQDDILTNLAKIGELKVISRTSVMPYRGKEKTVREIGKALGVANVLEGSVRKDKGRVRVNVQLINAETDQHIWAEDYDRDLTDVFAIQTDLAQKIAEELQAKLSPTEKAQMTRKPTDNGEAYLAFVEAHNLNMQLEDHDKLKQAEQLYERAIQLDPKFALAFASLSQLQSWIFHTTDPTPARRDRARDLAQNALQLQADMPEAHLALGFYYYYGETNYNAALSELSIAQHGLPNEAEVYIAMGAIERRQGRWAESTASFAKAVALDPNNTWPLQNLFFNYQLTRDFDAAGRTIDRALKLQPQALPLWGLKSKLAVAARADTSVADKAIAMAESMQLNPETRVMLLAGEVNVLMIQRRFAEAIEKVRQLPEDQLTATGDIMAPRFLVEGILCNLLHDEAGARDALTKAKAFAEQSVAQAPNDPARHSYLAQVLAYLGDKEGAVAEGKRAVELRPESIDAFDGPMITEQLAEVYAIVGEPDKAIDLLDGLLSRPSAVTVPLLKIGFMWDGIRDNPRFQALLQKYGAKT
jgi:TolB-like protein/Tfp pilus assembly protein PilF